LSYRLVQRQEGGFHFADIGVVLAQKPDGIASSPTDPAATAAACKAGAAAGVKLVFMDNVPTGLVAGKDFVGSGSADTYANRVDSAHLLAKAPGGKGEIGLVFHAADFFVTRQRQEGLHKTLTDEYPDIRIVAQEGIEGPDFAGQADRAAAALGCTVIGLLRAKPGKRDELRAILEGFVAPIRREQGCIDHHLHVSADFSMFYEGRRSRRDLEAQPAMPYLEILGQCGAELLAGEVEIQPCTMLSPYGR
jgi:quinol monooxygenase YgiN